MLLYSRLKLILYTFKFNHSSPKSLQSLPALSVLANVRLISIEDSKALCRYVHEYRIWLSDWMVCG